MPTKRIQLTLFVDPAESAPIEAVRRQYNPEQFALIAAHVTLCREDELALLEPILHRLRTDTPSALALHFGPPCRFSEGKGVWLPARDEQGDFQALRARVLQDVTGHPRPQAPHITLLHPRNATCTDESFAAIAQTAFPQRIVFPKISLIEQEAGRAWEVLQEIDLIPIRHP